MEIKCGSCSNSFSLWWTKHKGQVFTPLTCQPLTLSIFTSTHSRACKAEPICRRRNQGPGSSGLWQLLKQPRCEALHAVRLQDLSSSPEHQLLSRCGSETRRDSEIYQEVYELKRSPWWFKTFFDLSHHRSFTSSWRGSLPSGSVITLPADSMLAWVLLRLKTLIWISDY